MPAQTQSLPFSPAELAYLHTSLSSHPPIRPDSRSAHDFRPLSAETGMLPTTNGSAHVSFSDGSECIVGVKAEVERTPSSTAHGAERSGGPSEDVEMLDTTTKPATNSNKAKGKAELITLTLTLPAVRDDESTLVFLEEMLREPLILPTTSATGERTSLQDRLVINSRWHWHLYIDVLLVSAGSAGMASTPLPMLSMAVYLALRDTRLPRLKSEGEEDPVADDDWEASLFVYPREIGDRDGGGGGVLRPPVTLLVVVVGENVIFDPSREELSVADGVLAVSVGGIGAGPDKAGVKMLAMRMLDTGARDTMKGVPRVEREVGRDVPGVWKPRVGGLKREMVKKVVKEILGGGVGLEVLDALNGFTDAEREAETRQMQPQR